jgi:hypothetical protein
MDNNNKLYICRVASSCNGIWANGKGCGHNKPHIHRISCDSQCKSEYLSDCIPYIDKSKPIIINEDGSYV